MSIVQRHLALTAVAGIALAGALAAGSAQARDADVQWSVTIGSPVWTVPAPVPVYRAPAPVYVPVAPVYPVVRYRQPTYWDRDGDGIPNRYDRVYNPVWDRDGDGIPDRYDRHPGYGRGDGHHRDWRDRDMRPAPYMSDR